MNQSADEDEDSEDERREAEEAVYQQIYYQTFQSSFALGAAPNGIRTGSPSIKDGSPPHPPDQTKPNNGSPGLGERNNGSVGASDKASSTQGGRNRLQERTIGCISSSYISDDLDSKALDRSRIPVVGSTEPEHKGTRGGSNDYSLFLKLGAGCNSSEESDGSEEDCQIVGLTTSEKESRSNAHPLENVSTISSQKLRKTNRTLQFAKEGRAITKGKEGQTTGRSRAKQTSPTVESELPPKIFDISSDEVVILQDSDEALGLGDERQTLRKSPSSDCIILSSGGGKSSDENSSDVVIIENPYSSKLLSKSSTLEEGPLKPGSSLDDLRNGFHLDAGHSDSGGAIVEGEPDVPHQSMQSAVCASPSENQLDHPGTTKAALQFVSPPSVHQNSKGQRYFDRSLRDDNSKCGLCYCVGHARYDCPELRKLPLCVLCGTRGHMHYHCPQKLCFNCDLPGHQSRDCVYPYQAPYSQCERCTMYGHLAEMCPDQWRQYHLTTESGELVTAKCPHLGALTKKYCYNCGRRGHLGHMCIMPMMTVPRGEKAQLPTMPLVCMYKKLRYEKLRAKEKTRPADRQVKSASVKKGDSSAIKVDELPAVEEINPWTGTTSHAGQRTTHFQLPSFYFNKTNRLFRDNNSINNVAGTRSLPVHEPCQSKTVESPAVAPVQDVNVNPNSVTGNDAAQGNGFGSKVNERKKRKKAWKEERKRRKRAKLDRGTSLDRSANQEVPEVIDLAGDDEVKIHISGQTDKRTDKQKDEQKVTDKDVGIVKIVLPQVIKKTKNRLKAKMQKKRQAARRKAMELIGDTIRPLTSSTDVIKPSKRSQRRKRAKQNKLKRERMRSEIQQR